MLTVICGEDSVSSYNYYSNLKSDYKNKQYEVIEITASDLENINLWLGESQSLFSTKKVFFTQNLNKKLSRKLNLKINNIIDEIIINKNIEVVDFEEEISSRFLKFPKGILIKEYKLPISIFKLQDSLFPGNLKNFSLMLDQLLQSSDENFIFIMIIRHIRNLILVKTGSEDKKLQKWQVYKLKSQSAKWETDKLINFYDSFHKIDESLKTSTNPYSLKKSLDIVACYYL